MTSMKASVLIHWILVLQSILVISRVHTEDYQAKYDGSSEDLEAIVTEKSISSLFYPSWMTVSVRSKRNEEVKEETIPTRHAKHRKRRRCKNRSACFRGTTASRLFSPRSNETELVNQNSSDNVLSVEESRIGTKNRTQELYNETKGEEYDATEAVEVKGRFEAKERTPSAGSNVSIDDSIPESELIDAYDERVFSEEADFEKTDTPTKTKGRSRKNEIGEGMDYTDDSSVFYMAVDDQVAIHESLSVLLKRLFQNLRNASETEGRDIFKELNFVNATNEDPCQKWLNSKVKLEKVFLGGLASLPACPCEYPSNIFYDDKIWDEKQKKHFRWRDVSGNSQRLDIYKPGATYCVRSLLTQGSGSVAAQHCCYDRRRKLLTRGSGAGTPNFVSPEISPILHERIDVLPWRLCKGDFSRYNGVRPPNNDNGCEANPDDEEYQRQIDNTKYY